MTETPVELPTKEEPPIKTDAPFPADTPEPELLITVVALISKIPEDVPETVMPLVVLAATRLLVNSTVAEPDVVFMDIPVPLPCNDTLLKLAPATAPPVGAITMPELPESITVSLTKSLPTPVSGAKLIPAPAEKPKKTQSSTKSSDMLSALIPLMPVVIPCRVMPRILTIIPAPLTTMAFVPDTRMEPSVPVQSSVTDLVIVTAPNPPGSRQSISPPAAVFEIAPAKVLHGAVRLHGLTSSPTPETQVRVACA